MAIYVVQPFDTVDRIATVNQTDVWKIIYDNQLIYPYELAVGQALFIQNGTGSGKRNVVSGGYAYPFISPWVLEQTLPFLTELYVFSYGFTTQGTLVYPLLDDTFMIQMAYEYATDPILTLTPFGADGNFNNQLIHAIVNNVQAAKRLIENLLAVMEQKGYMGVDIDFEFILPEDRDAFTGFVRRMADAMHAEGYRLSVALAPKTSAEQPGLLYQGKDYGALGSIADTVLLMTYEWGYTYGPPMAVAPVNQVRRVVEYAITEIPIAKINLGIPNYGYDWTLPFVRGESRAVTIGNVEAVRIAVAYGAEIQFDELAKSPWFYYWENGRQHQVWFEDVRSLQAKFDLIKEFGLHGCGYWQIMQLFRANWLLLEENFNIE